MKNSVKRATVYLDPELHRALKVRAAETDYSISEIVNEAVRNALLEDALDLEAFETRQDEPLVAFEDILKKLKKNGKI